MCFHEISWLKLFCQFFFTDCCYEDAHWIILEPIMLVEVNVPQEFQGSALSLITHRDGVIMGMYDIQWKYE